MIKIKNISKSFGDQTVLKDLSVNLKKNEKYCIKGASGYGKTTFLHIISGIIKPDSGTIDGIEDMTKSVIFQEDRLCENLGVQTNLRFIINDKNKNNIVQEILEQMLLTDSLHKPIRELSGGMKRRVAIARALCVDADLMIFDEPFDGLDPKTKEHIIDYTQKKCENKTVIWVTHDLREAEIFKSKIIELSDINNI